MADLTLVEPKTQKGDLYPRLDVEEPWQGQVYPGFGQGQIGRHTGGAELSASGDTIGWVQA